MTPADENCPNCGAPVRPDQDWCLNCGSAVNTRIASAPNWRAPLAIVAAVLVLAAAGIVVAFLELSNDAEKVASTVPTTRSPTPTPSATVSPTISPSATASPSSTATTSPSPSPSASASPSASPDASASPSSTPSASATIPPVSSTASPFPTVDSDSGSGDNDSGSGSTAKVQDWPSGDEAWTVVMLSSRSKADADKRARDLVDGGTSAGVLRSSDFSSLRAGYWVVFSGRHDSQAKAESALSRLKSKAPGAYVKFVRPK